MWSIVAPAHLAGSLLSEHLIDVSCVVCEMCVLCRCANRSSSCVSQYAMAWYRMAYARRRAGSPNEPGSPQQQHSRRRERVLSVTPLVKPYSYSYRYRGRERRGRCRGASPSGPRLSRGARYCPSTAVASSSCILQERRRRTPPWLASASAACHGQLQLLAAVAGSRLWRAHTQSQHALAPTCYSKCVAHPSIV